MHSVPLPLPPFSFPSVLLSLYLSLFLSLGEIVDLVFWGLLLAHTFTAVFLMLRLHLLLHSSPFLFRIKKSGGEVFVGAPPGGLLLRLLPVPGPILHACILWCFFSRLSSPHLYFHLFIFLLDGNSVAVLVFASGATGGNWGWPTFALSQVLFWRSLTDVAFFVVVVVVWKTFWKLRQVHFYFSNTVHFPSTFSIPPSSPLNCNQSRHKEWKKKIQKRTDWEEFSRLCLIFHVLVLKTTTNCWKRGVPRCRGAGLWVGACAPRREALSTLRKKINKAINAKRVAGEL